MKAAQIIHLLPQVFQQSWRADGPLNALLEAMEVLQEPAERAVEDFPRYLNPRLTPERFLPMLSQWMDLDHLFAAGLRQEHVDVDRLMPAGSGRLRELIANAAPLSRLRGTLKGLASLLRIAVGLDGFMIAEHVDGNRLPRPFHICVSGPVEAEPWRPLIEDLIRSWKPAHLTFEFVTNHGE